MSDYSSFAKPVDDYSSFAKPVEDYSSFAKPVEEEEDSVLSKKGLLDIASAMPFALAKQAQGVKRAFGDLIGNEEMAGNAASAMKTLQDEEAKVKMNLGDGVGSMAYQGVKGTLANAPALTVGAINPALGLAAIGAGTGGEAYSKYRDRGASKADAATGGILEGSIEAGTELLPMKYLLGKLGKEGFMNFVKGMLIREFPGEQIATLAQDAVDTAIANPNKTWQDYLAERPKAALATAIATGVQVGLTGGAGAAVHRLTPKGTDAASDVAANLDALDKQKEIQKQTQGEGTLYVGKTGDVTSELPTRIEETPEQIDVARTELQNNLQREATASQGEDPQLTFLNEDGTINYKPQELDLQVSPEGAAPAPTNQAPRTQSPEFKEWFGNSKLVDDSGNPMVFYHGTNVGKTGTAFDSFRAGPHGKLGKGIYFTPNKGVADRFTYGVEENETGRTIIPTYLKVENPIVVKETRGQPLEQLKDALDLPDSATKEDVSIALKKAGYDSVLLKDMFGNITEVMVLDPSQIKSVYNQGTWSKDTPNISKVGGEPKLLSDTSSPEMSRSFSKEDFRGMTFLRNGKEGVTPETIFNHIRKNLRQEGDTELNKVVDAVEGFLKKFNQGGVATHGLHIELADTPTVRASAQDSPAAGYYWTHDHSLVLGKEGQNVRTFVHEVLHGLTERYMEVYPNSPEVKQLKSLFDQVKAHPLAKGKYGTLNHSEMLTEAFSSRSFKRALMNIEVKVKGQMVSAWQAFTEAMFSLVGMKKDYNPATLTAFEQLLNLTDEITTKAAKDFADVAKKYKIYEAKGVLPSQLQQLVAQAGSNPAPSNSASSVKISDPEVSKADQIESISGEVYIPKNPVIDEALINKIKGEKDGSTWNALTPGALAKSELGQSTLVKTVYRLMNGAYKRAEYKTNTIVKPAKDTFIKILKNPTKAKISHEILMRELKKGTDYTADELRSAGVSDDVIKAHLEFRSMMQQALEAQNAALRAKGLPEVKGIDAYISSRWSGPWRANIKDADGNIVWQVAEHSKKKAQDAIEWIKAKQPDLKFEDPVYRKGFERGDNVEAGYLDMLKMLDKDDPRVAVLESIYKDYLTGNTENVASQEKHHLRKKGVRGFAGDRAWSDNDVRDFFTQQFAYAENAFKWSEAQKSVEGVKELLNNPDLQESQKNNIAFSKDYVKNQLGFGTSESFDSIDNGLAKLVGTSPQNLQEYMGAAKTFFYLTKLGLSVPFTITQFLQPAITTPGWHAQLDSLGYKHNPIRSTFKSIVGGAEAALWHYGIYFNAPELKAAAEKQMNPLDLEAAKYMEANGIIDINPMTDIKKGLRPAAVSMVAAPFEFTIKHSEVIARSMAFMGFVDHLKQSGKFDLKTHEGRLKLFEKAEDMTNLSMTDYRTQERAMVFEKMGLTGDAAATLHSYQINNLMQLVKFGKEAKTGNVKPLIYMIGMQAAAAGLAGLWFVDDLDDLIDNLKKLLPHDEYLKMKDFSIKKFIMENLGDVASHGLVSNVSGTNIHTRLNASDQLPIWPFESQEDPLKNILGVAPFIESTYDVGKGAFNAVRPGATPQERWAGAYATAPTVAQGPMENLPAFSDAGVSLKTKDLSMGQIRRTEEEKNLRNYGFRSVREQKMKDAEFQLSKVERELTDRQNTAAKKAKEYVISGEPKQAVEQMIRYDQLGGDLQALINGIPKAKLNRVTTELERRALASQGGTKTSILKLQRYMQSVPQ